MPIFKSGVSNMRKIPEYITNCGGIPPAIPEEISESPADCGDIPPEPILKEEDLCTEPS